MLDGVAVLSRALMLASAAVVTALGVLHLAYTLHGRKLLPRDDLLVQAMANTHLGLTTQTTVWKAWLGFNLSHGLGLLLFGAIYGCLAVGHADLLFRSPGLLLIGAGMLCALLLLAKLYWFDAPLLGMALALTLYAGSWLLHRP